jgi:altronate dehydratase large subunit
VERLRLYRNPDGSVGARRHVVVLGLNAFCATAAARVGEMVAGTTVVVHPHGRNEVGKNRWYLDRSLRGIVRNGNVHSVLVVGYERETTERFVDEVRAATGKRVEAVVLLECGGSWAAAAEGARKAAALVLEASRARREEVSWGELRVGVKCGGSDGSSVLASNPVVGRCADRLVDLGAAVVFSETTEIIGAERLLAKRARTREVAEQILAVARRNLEVAEAAGVDLMGTNPVPDNIAGGISTIEEKALGAILKAGTRPIDGVLEYGQPPQAGGLYFMDSPSGAHEVMSGFAVAGCQVVLFATGTCNPVGNALMPVVKVCGNREWVGRMADHVDVDVSGVVEEGMDLNEAADRVWEVLVRVLGGERTRTEICGHREFVVVPTGL